jgi:hypothetical protein
LRLFAAICRSVATVVMRYRAGCMFQLMNIFRSIQKGFCSVRTTSHWRAGRLPGLLARRTFRIKSLLRFL